MTALSASRLKRQRLVRAVFAEDIRRLGGVVSVHPCRDRQDGSMGFQISHVSKGGDLAWRSPPIIDEDRAFAAAHVLAAFVGGIVR